MAPIASSPSRVSPATAAMQRTKPPGITPSSTAARGVQGVLDPAFFSFISVSVAAPTLITATPPTSFARRSCSFSRS